MIHNKVKKIKKVLELKNPTTFSKHGPRSKYSYIKLDKYKSENLFALYTTSLGAISWSICPLSGYEISGVAH